MAGETKAPSLRGHGLICRRLSMADTYKSFQELKAQEREGEDWTREYISRGSRILVMAPHGGWIEPFTSELARAVAGNDLSLYTFQGLKERGNESLHLTSHRFDEPLGLRAASAAHWVLAIHGERSPDRPFVMVGGLWNLVSGSSCRGLSKRPAFRWRARGRGLDGVNPDEHLQSGTLRDRCTAGDQWRAAAGSAGRTRRSFAGSWSWSGTPCSRRRGR